MQTLQQHSLQIGPLALETPILLAPMAGYTDLPFRTLLRSLGGLGLAFTEMVNPQSVLIGKGKRRGDLLATLPGDRPLGHQIYGVDPDRMSEAARWLEDIGAQLIDINMGCPQKEITSSGAGAALLRKPAEAARLAERVVSTVSIPVTAKIRLGWDADSIIAADLARDLERAGIAALTVHGRTRAQGFGGEANLEEIRRVVEAVDRIPVIGNGDINSPEAGLRMLRETGCAGVMVARGAARDPWLARDLWQALQGLPPLPAPTRAERMEMLREQLERTVLHYGEQHAVAIFRRWIVQGARQMRWGREAMIRVLKITGIAEMRRALEAECACGTEC